jgi:hypothetical protein
VGIKQRGRMLYAATFWIPARVTPNRVGPDAILAASVYSPIAAAFLPAKREKTTLRVWPVQEG